MGLVRYRRLAIISTIGVCLLTVAGGAVRLTGSGLGCDDWPACNQERFIDVSSMHAAIEQINRIFSGLIGLPVLALFVGSFFVRNRTGLRWPAAGVFVTVFANGVVGGLAVLGDLHPALVQSHFLLAMLSIAFGLVAIRRSGPTPSNQTLREPWSVLLAVTTFAALVSGTVVTGTGPHAGDETARRFGFDISNVARTHSIIVIVSIVIALVLAWTVRHRHLAGVVSSWMFVGLLQGVIGYVQYFNDVPELLVGLHIAGATGLWVVTVWLLLVANDTELASPDVPAALDDLTEPKHSFASS
ncbi:MAG: COX15/CtaA family protein [Ilumatobacter sp.]|jgi:heme a synthase|uniref:COX15/CtaA family protein n=1 Tax=Ilumatobacter sp. TaxID=1967498 RepID=UPI00391B0D3C